MRITLVVGLLLALAGGAGWFALRPRPNTEPPSSPVAVTSPSVVNVVDASAEAFHSLLSAKTGQVTAGDIAKQRELLLNRSRESRATLERSLRSEDQFERLIAFRLLLELDGWTPQLNAVALQDSFVLLRVEAADWLYLARRFEEWDTFLSASSKNSTADYRALMPTMRNLRWRGIPAGAELLGIGHGIDRYYREVLRRSDTAASVAESELSSSAISQFDQQPLVRLLHEANRPDYEAFLRELLTRTAEDTPARFEAIWLIGQAFATPANRDLFVQHLAAHASDPLHSRVEQALASINEQLSRGSDRLIWFEARLAVAQRSGSQTAIGAALVALLDEALRVSHVTDKPLLQAANQVLPAQVLDYAARRRLADIDFLLQRSK